MNVQAITRVAQFMSMVIAHQMCANDIDDRSKLDRSKIAFQFMGSGASDMLTLGDLLDFEAQATDLSQRKPPPPSDYTQLQSQSSMLHEAAWKAAQRVGMLGPDDHPEATDLTDYFVRIFEKLFAQFDEYAKLHTLKQATEVIQANAGRQIVQARDAVTKLSDVLDSLARRTMPSNNVAGACLAIPEELKLVTDLADMAYTAFEDGRERADGCFVIGSEDAKAVTAIMDAMDEFATRYDDDTQAHDGRSLGRALTSKLASMIHAFTWVAYDPDNPAETLPRESGMYLVECYDPGQGPNMNGEPEYPANTYYHVCDVNVLFGRDGRVHDYDFTVRGIGGDFDWDRDVTRYARIPVFDYALRIAEDEDVNEIVSDHIGLPDSEGGEA